MSSPFIDSVPSSPLHLGCWVVAHIIVGIIHLWISHPSVPAAASISLAVPSPTPTSPLYLIPTPTALAQPSLELSDYTSLIAWTLAVAGLATGALAGTKVLSLTLGQGSLLSVFGFGKGSPDPEGYNNLPPSDEDVDSPSDEDLPDETSDLDTGDSIDSPSGPPPPPPPDFGSGSGATSGPSPWVLCFLIAFVILFLALFVRRWVSSLRQPQAPFDYTLHRKDLLVDVLKMLGDYEPGIDFPDYLMRLGHNLDELPLVTEAVFSNLFPLRLLKKFAIDHRRMIVLVGSELALFVLIFSIAMSFLPVSLAVAAPLVWKYLLGLSYIDGFFVVGAAAMFYGWRNRTKKLEADIHILSESLRVFQELAPRVVHIEAEFARLSRSQAALRHQHQATSDHVFTLQQYVGENLREVRRLWRELGFLQDAAHPPSYTQTAEEEVSVPLSAAIAAGLPRQR